MQLIYTFNLVRHKRCAFTDVGKSSEDKGATSEAVCEICNAGTYSYEAASECQDWSVDALDCHSINRCMAHMS